VTIDEPGAAPRKTVRRRWQWLAAGTAAFALLTALALEAVDRLKESAARMQ
jgi:hypothetical protein